MLELGQKYNQHTVIHKQDDGNFSLLGSNNSPGNSVGKVHVNFDHGGRSISVDARGDKFKDLFSKLHKGTHSAKKKKFLFKVQEKIETSMYYHKQHGEQWYEIL
jgi:hypothetical protein